MVVIEYSKSNRAACRTCSKPIEKDVLKFGTVKGNDGYMNMEWHHQTCFWEKRAGQYYKRKNKRVNILLKCEQFSGQHILDDQQLQLLRDNIDKSNLRWGTVAALEKAGIAVPEPAPRAKPAARPAKEETVPEEEPEPAAVQESEELPAKRRRVATTKYA